MSLKRTLFSCVLLLGLSVILTNPFIMYNSSDTCNFEKVVLSAIYSSESCDNQIYFENSDVIESIKVDVNGYIYVTGWTESTGFPFTAKYSTKSTTQGNIFVAKFNPTGSTLIYSLVLGGSNSQQAKAITVDHEGCAYITGYTTSPDFPTTQGAYSTTYRGGFFGWDTFITKISADGESLLYSTFLGGNGDDYGFDIVIDDNGCAYISGTTESVDFPTTSGAYDTSYNDIETVYATDVPKGDIFIIKFNFIGDNLVFSTYLGGSNRDDVREILLSDEGDVYITGFTRSINFPTTAGTYNTIYNGSAYYGFISKLHVDGTTLIYSTFLGAGQTLASGIAVDDDGNAYVTGQTDSSDFPTTIGAYDSTFNGDQDIFVIKLASDGSNIIYSTLFGGNDFESVSGIYVNNECIYIAGHTRSIDFSTTGTMYRTSKNGRE